MRLTVLWAESRCGFYGSNANILSNTARHLMFAAPDYRIALSYSYVLAVV